MCLINQCALPFARATEVLGLSPMTKPCVLHPAASHCKKTAAQWQAQLFSARGLRRRQAAWAALFAEGAA